MSGADIDTVVINGNIVMENRKLLTINETEVMQKVREIAVNIKNSLQKIKEIINFMQLHNYSIHHKLIIILILLLPVCSSRGREKKSTLFPHSRKYRKQQKLILQCDKGKCLSVITLPSQADPESLVVSLPPQSRVKIEDVQVKPIQVQDEIKSPICASKLPGGKEKKRDAGKVAGARSTASVLAAKQKQKQKNTADASKLADAIGKKISGGIIKKN